MSSFSTTSASIPPVVFSAVDEARALRGVLREFDLLGATSDQLITATTDAVRVGDVPVQVPRYVFLGGQPGSATLKLAIYAGWSPADGPAAFALLETTRHLLRRPEHGQGYVLSLYPFVHASALERRDGPPRRDLKRVRWDTAAGTEIEQLAADFLAWELDGWISIQRRTGSDFIRATAFGLPVDPDYFPVEEGRFRIVWSAGQGEPPPGPLDLGAALAHRPFGLELELPAHWPDGIFAGAVSTTVRAFLVRYRAARAYGLHL